MTASSHATAFLDTAAVTLHSPSRVLAVSRAARPDHSRGAGEHRGAQDRIAVPVPTALRSERDQIGQVLRALKISEPLPRLSSCTRTWKKYPAT